MSLLLQVLQIGPQKEKEVLADTNELDEELDFNLQEFNLIEL